MKPRTLALILGGVAIALLATCGITVLVVRYFVAKMATEGGVGGVPGYAREWYTTEPCLVDANGDGVLDVAGMSGSPSEQTHASALDGKTGKLLWETAAFHEGSRAHCGDEHTLLVASPGFQLEGLDPKTGHKKWATRLRDEVVSAWPGDRCVEVSLMDGSRVGVDLASGKSASCHGQKPQDDMDPTRTPSWHARSSSVEVEMTTKLLGTRVLEVTASRGGKALWSKKLDVQSDFTKAPFLTATHDVIVVAGYDLVDKDHLVWLGLDPTTGRQLYRVVERSHWSSHFFHAKAAGDRIYAFWGYGMFAYDPRTAKQLWGVGGR